MVDKFLPRRLHLGKNNMASNTDNLRKGARRFVTQLSGDGIIDTVQDNFDLVTVVGLPTDTAIDLVIDRVDSEGNLTPNSEEILTCVCSGGRIIDAIRGVEGTARPHSEGAIVEMRLTASQWNSKINAFLAGHNQDGSHKAPVLISLQSGGINPNDGATTYHGTGYSTMPVVRAVIVPYNCVINTIYYSTVIAATIGSSERASAYLHVNGNTDYLIDNAVAANVAMQHLSKTDLGANISAGDSIEIKMVHPTYATNPVSVYYRATVVLDRI